MPLKPMEMSQKVEDNGHFTTFNIFFIPAMGKVSTAQGLVQTKIGTESM